MKTKLLYVLTSSPGDIYLEQAYVSMFSAKYHTKDVHIVLLTDEQTSKTFIGTRKKEIELVDELITVRLPDSLNAQQRSRQLKTSARNRVVGDFLFIDCDTIVARPLDSIDETNANLAACWDAHSKLADSPYRDLCIRHGKLLGWPIEDEQEYFNSGVIYVKDIPKTQDFYKRWNELLNEGYEKNVYMDQPAFAKANYEMGHIITHLPEEWNCEVKHGFRYFKDAFILHYLCTNVSIKQDEQLFLFNERQTFGHVKATGIIDKKIQETIENPCKGIAETTISLAGSDVFFIHSKGFYYIRKNYDTPFYPILEKIIYLLNGLSKCINHVLLKFKN